MQTAAAPSVAPERTNTDTAPVLPPLHAPEPVVVAPALVIEHPRPMSARELVAKLEALRAHEEAAEVAADAQHALPAIGDTIGEQVVAAAVMAEPPATPPEPRRFASRGGEWIARVAGRGTGGTGRVAQARLEIIHFSTSAEPDQIAAELIVPGAHLDDLYDDELAELLERGLRLKGNA